jgi:hypothetical protein
MTFPEPLWTTKDVANFLKMHPTTVIKKAERGELPCAKVFGKWRFIPSRIQELGRNGT